MVARTTENIASGEKRRETENNENGRKGIDLEVTVKIGENTRAVEERTMNGQGANTRRGALILYHECVYD